jgi:hypothetical protein
MGMDGVTSLIREKWQPACFAGNLKLTRYDYNLTIMKSPKPATDNRFKK